MEQKGWKSIGCRTHSVTLNFGLTNEFDWISRSNFEVSVS